MGYENSYARIVMREYKKFATDYSGPESEAARAPPPGGRCKTNKSFIQPSSSDFFITLSGNVFYRWQESSHGRRNSQWTKTGLELEAKYAYMRNI